MNFNSIDTIDSLRNLADRLGFEVGRSKYEHTHVSLFPKGNYKDLNATLPVYSRDAEFGYNGSVEETIAYLAGWQRCIEYMQAMKLVTDKKIEQKTIYWNKFYKKLEEEIAQQKLIDVLKK